MSPFDNKYSHFNQSQTATCSKGGVLRMDSFFNALALVELYLIDQKQSFSLIHPDNYSDHFSTELTLWTKGVCFFLFVFCFARSFLLISGILYTVFCKMIQINILVCGKRDLCGYSQR